MKSEGRVDPVPMVSVPSGSLEYVEKGKGVPLILLHGGTGSIDEWGTCVDAFAKKFRVIAYNRRGYGNSSPRYVFPADFYEEDMDDLTGLLDALDVVPPVFFCGFSDGGTLALMYAVRFPQYFRALVVSGAHIYVEEKTAQGLARVRERYEKRGKRNGLENTAPFRSQMAWFERWLGKSFRPFSIEDEMPRIPCPTLVVQGTEDEFAYVSHAKRIADGIPDSRLWLVPGARHWIHGGGDAPIFQEQVLAFFSDITDNDAPGGGRFIMDKNESGVKTGEKIIKRKPDPMKMQVLRSFPLEVKEKLSKEEVEAFLYGDLWPDSLYEKLKGYMVDEPKTSV